MIMGTGRNYGNVYPLESVVKSGETYGYEGTTYLGTFGVAPVILPGALENSPAKILQEYLIQNSIEDMTDPVDNNAWPLYVGYMPDGVKAKTDIASAYDTPGIKDGRQMDGEVNEHYGVQIKVRSDDYLEGYLKAQALGVATESISRAEVTIDSDSFLLQNVSIQGPVVPLGREKGTSGRMFFTINLLLTIEKIE